MARPDKKEKKEGAKTARSKGVRSQKWKAYAVSGDSIKRERKSCPKCGEGVFLAQHKDRQSCGKCGYTEFAKKA